MTKITPIDVQKIEGSYPSATFTAHAITSSCSFWAPPIARQVCVLDLRPRSCGDNSTGDKVRASSRALTIARLGS